MLTRQTLVSTMFLSLSLVICASAQSGGTFTIQQKVISAGSRPAAGGTLAVQNTTGQPVAGPISGGTFAIQAGFWTATAFPTAASVMVTGRTLSSLNTPVMRATVTLTDPAGQVFKARVGRSGSFQVEVPAGQTYVVTVRHRSYAFTPLVLTLQDSVADLELRSEN